MIIATALHELRPIAHGRAPSAWVRASQVSNRSRQFCTRGGQVQTSVGRSRNSPRIFFGQHVGFSCSQPGNSTNAIRLPWYSSFNASYSSMPPSPSHSSQQRQQWTTETQLGISNGQGVRSRINGLTEKLPPSNTLRRRRRSIPPRKRSSAHLSGTVHPVTAVHLGQSINLSSVMSSVFPSHHGKQAAAYLSDKKSLVLELPTNRRTPPEIISEPPQYIAVYGFGSVVGLNIPPKAFQNYLDRVRPQVVDPVRPGCEKREDFGIMLQPSDLYPTSAGVDALVPGESTPVITGDYCVMSTLDLDGVAVISNIMAQTVALDTYNATADDYLQKFAAINSSVRASGKFKTSDRSLLFKSVAHNNAIFIDMISKIRLKDRSDTAWNVTKYEDIHYGLKAEFEIDDRFDQIEYKLNLVQQNSKFFLSVLASEKSNSLEWTIVILIVAECILMCIEMSGMGTVIMSKLGSFIPRWY